MYSYPEIAAEALQHITTDLAPIDQAVVLLSDVLSRGGVIQAFATGHARTIAHELSGRAGGLVPVNLVRLTDLAASGDLPLSSLMDPTLERDPDLGAQVLDLLSPDQRDGFVIASHSGINGAVVELAIRVRERGMPIVAITSLAHSQAVRSRHASGLRLADLADVVIDTGAPVGDAALSIDEDTKVGALSSLTGVFIAQLLTEGIARTCIDRDGAAPVYRSMNLPGNDEANARWEQEYAGRVHPIEP